jgi:hypothetical protein
VRQRLRGLRKIASLYGVMEDMRRSELERAVDAVREVEEAVAVQRSAVVCARLDGRAALADGDRLGRTTADKQREVAGWKRIRLEEELVKREAASAVARQRYLSSRIESEQMKRVRDDAARMVEVDEGRRMQAIVDDRFLSRRRWIAAQDDPQMRES